MNNNRKTVYIIAILAVIFLFFNIYTNYRFINGKYIEENRQLAFNTDDAHGVSIKENSKFTSFESGLTYQLNVDDLPLDENNVVTIAIPLKRLKPEVVYRASLIFTMTTSNVEQVVIESNSQLGLNQADLSGDIKYKPITLVPSMREYAVDFEFETNEAGASNILISFEVSDDSKPITVNIGLIRVEKIREVPDANNVDEQQSSQASLEII